MLCLIIYEELNSGRLIFARKIIPVKHLPFNENHKIIILGHSLIMIPSIYINIY